MYLLFYTYFELKAHTTYIPDYERKELRNHFEAWAWFKYRGHIGD